MPDICWVDFAHLFREGVISLENADKIPFFFFYRQCERIAFCWNNIFYDNTVNKWRAGGEVLYICDTLYRSACHFIHLALGEKKKQPSLFGGLRPYWQLPSRSELPPGCNCRFLVAVQHSICTLAPEEADWDGAAVCVRVSVSVCVCTGTHSSPSSGVRQENTSCVLADGNAGAVLTTQCQ